MPSAARLLAALALALLGAAPARAELLAGAAEVDVTPEVGTPLAGYGGRLRRGGPDLDPRTPATLFRASTGVRDPIEAQALVLVDGATVAALLAVDAIGVEEALLDEVVRAARARGVPLGPGAVVLAASHTHSGPGAVARTPLWALTACDLLSRRVHDRLVAGLADALARAWAGRRPARVADGAAEVRGATRNRRAGRSALVGEDDVDPRLGLLRVDDAASGAPLAVVVHFAVHGTCLGDENLALSADVPGALRRAVRVRAGCPTLFLNGCEGDVAPRPGGEAGLAAVPARVAPVADALLRGLAPAGGARLRVASVRRDLGPLVLHPGLGEDLLAGGDDAGAAERALAPLARGVLRLVRGAPGGRVLGALAPRTYRFTALRLGDLVLVTVPGEPIGAVGPGLEALAREVGAARTWVVGLANGHFGYLTTPDEYAQGGYEAWLTFHGPGQAAAVAAAVGDALAGVSSRPW